MNLWSFSRQLNPFFIWYSPSHFLAEIYEYGLLAGPMVHARLSIQLSFCPYSYFHYHCVQLFNSLQLWQLVNTFSRKTVLSEVYWLWQNFSRNCVNTFNYFENYFYVDALSFVISRSYTYISSKILKKKLFYISKKYFSDSLSLSVSVCSSSWMEIQIYFNIR